MPVVLNLGPTGAPGTEVRLEQDGSVIRRSVLPGGIRVLSEAMPAQHSATIGAWVAVGSRDETDGHHGSTHFLEHLLFKGTARRDAMDIAVAFDAVGGEANAATGKEHTCYYARVLDVDVPMAVDVITDMITSALLDPQDLEVERGVILEELAMAGDDPVDVAHEQFAAAVLGPHPLGRPIGGTPATIRAVPHAAVLDHYRRTYVPAELVITAAGAIDHDALCQQVLDAVRAAGWDLDDRATPTSRRAAVGEIGATTGGRGAGAPDDSPALHAGGGPGETPDGSVVLDEAATLDGPDGLPTAGRALTIRRTTEQANVLLGCQGLSAGDDRRWVLAVLMTALGGGMSSRLFQEIRERRGLAYSTYAFAASYAEAGTIGLYAGCAPENTEQVIALLGQEFDRVAAAPLPDEELARAIGQLSGNLVLGLEDSGSRMSRLGRAEIVHGELTSIDEVLDRVRAVTAEQVQELAADLVGRVRSLVVVGPFEHDIAGDLLSS